MSDNRLSFSKVKSEIISYLSQNVGPVKEYEITYAKLDKSQWRVNVEYVLRGTTATTPRIARFSVDAGSGEVTEYQRGTAWRE